LVLVPTFVIIALAGVAAETGVVMLMYLDEAYERGAREGRMATAHDVAKPIHSSSGPTAGGVLSSHRPIGAALKAWAC
jgi:hypothetical protein